MNTPNIGDVVTVAGLFGRWTLKSIDPNFQKAIVTDGIMNHVVDFMLVTKVSSQAASNQASNQIPDWLTYTPTIPGRYNISIDAETSNKWLGNYSPGKIEWNTDPVHVVLGREHGVVPKAPECECGSHKTYGTNCSSDMHSTWCKLFSKAST